MKEWYQISTEDVKKKMETSEHGLTTEEAAKRLAQYGENVLAEGKKKSVFAVFFGQFADLLVGILIVAAVISACSGNPESTFVILVVIVLNALLGTVQYVKAEKSLESLKDLTSPNAKVLRSGVKVFTALISPMVPMLIMSSAGTPLLSYFLARYTTSRRLWVIRSSRAAASPAAIRASRTFSCSGVRGGGRLGAPARKCASPQ